MALVVRRAESLIGASNFVLLPLTFLSPVFMAPALMPAWIQRVARLNPVSWAVTAARSGLSAHPNWALIATCVGELLLLSAVSAWIASRAFRSYQRSI
jgi:ABC-2 type transport system permease protein